MDYLYYICDVFTDRRFGGNQLAVIPDARGLSDEQMQQIAREFNFAETTFVLPPQAGQTRHVRIFTPLREIAFAGHPNLGTAFVLAMTDPALQGARRLVFEEAAGLVTITLGNPENGVMYCELEAPQPLIIGDVVPISLVAEALGLPPSTIITRHHQPRVCSVGLPVTFAEVESRDVLAGIRTSQAAFRRLANNHLCNLLHVYQDCGDNHFEARVFGPMVGVPEDAATGSANCAFGGLLAACDARPDGEFSWTVTQGVAMGRPSLLRPRALKERGRVTSTWIGGHSVMFSQGTVFMEQA